jgi:transporter family protein
VRQGAEISGVRQQEANMKSVVTYWQFRALAAAGFAALTAIFAKVGVAGVGSDFATMIRTVVILSIGRRW